MMLLDCHILYILDSGNNRIVKYDLVNKISTECLISDNGNNIELGKAAGLYGGGFHAF